MDDQQAAAAEAEPVGLADPNGADASPRSVVAGVFPMTPVEPRSPGYAVESPPEHAEDDASRWISDFLAWPDSLKAEALERLVVTLDSAPTGRRHTLMLDGLLRPLMKRDFISLLPQELALQILGYLDARSLLACGAVCRGWRYLADKDKLWRRHSPNLDGFPETLSSSLHRYAEMGSRLTWKSMFLIRCRVRSAWRSQPLPEPVELPTHFGNVITCLALADGGRVVSASDDYTLKVWSRYSRRCLKTLTGHEGGVWCCDVEGDLLVSGSTDRRLKVWNMSEGRCLHTLEGHQSTVRCVKIQGSKIMSGSRDCTIRLWDAIRGTHLHTFLGHTDAVRCGDFDGETIVSGSYDCTVKVWSVASLELLHNLEGHERRVYCVQFNKPMVASGSLDGSIRVWSVLTGVCLRVLSGHLSLTAMMWMEGNTLVSGNADNTLRVWNISTGHCMHVLRGHRSSVTSLAVLPGLIISSSDDGTTKLWDMHTGQFIRDLYDAAREPGAGSSGVVWSVVATETQLICAVGGDANAAGNKLVLLDFLSSAMTT